MSDPTELAIYAAMFAQQVNECGPPPGHLNPSGTSAWEEQVALRAHRAAERAVRMYRIVRSTPEAS